MSLYSELGLKKGQRFTLTPEDFEGDLPEGKSKAALIGLAIDAHIKRLLASRGAEVPAYRYSVYDVKSNNIHFDIKSYGANSVTVSEKEWDFALEQFYKGDDVIYIIFEQLNDLDFEFRGFISAQYLRDKGKIRNSQFNGGVFFSPSVVKL